MTTVVPLDGTANASVVVNLTRHAVERYRERVRPGLSVEAAAGDLMRLAPRGAVAPSAPAWLHRHTYALFLVIGDICFPLAPDCRAPETLTATTCLCRGMR